MTPEHNPQFDPATSPWSRPGGEVIGGLPHWAVGAGTQPIPDYPDAPPPTAARKRGTFRSVIAGVALVAVGAAAGAGIVDVARHSTNSTAAASSQPVITQPGSGGTGSSGDGTFGGFGGFGGTGGGATGGSSSGDGSGTSGSGSSGSGSSSTSGSDGPTDAAAIAKDVDPGIVDITTVVAGGEAAGTGMVLTSTGEILTNNHVIDGAMKISVRDVGNGKTYSATVVGYDRTHDVAVLQLTAASGLTTIKTATSAAGVGAAVVGVGNAGGSGGTPSYAGGAVTATGQSITASDESDGTSEQLTGLLQTDAAIEPGDSGGPLVNAAGEVVGMDTAASSTYSFQGASSQAAEGFAIPIATAESIAKQIESGTATSTIHLGSTAQLGVYISGRDTESGGALVEQTTSGSPAAAAGIVAGDTITSVNGTSVSSPDDLAGVISTLKPGQTVSVGVTTQDGGTERYSVTLGTGTPQ